MLSRKAVFFVTILALMMSAVVVVTAQDENWCDEGGRWYNTVFYAPETNRCDAQPDAPNQSTMWFCGWVGAQHELSADIISFERFLNFDDSACSGNLLFELYHDQWSPPATPTPEPEPAATAEPIDT